MTASARRLTIAALSLGCRARAAAPERHALPPALSLPAHSEAPVLGARETIVAAGISLVTTARIEDHGRGRVACQYDPRAHAVVCVTDMLSDDWRRKGVRVLRIDPARFEVRSRTVASTRHSSFLWGDFNRDGALDFWGFSDELDAPTPRAALYLGTEDPWGFRATEPIAVGHPVRGGAVLDANADGCEDLLLLGTGIEFQAGRAPEYFRDGLYRGDCRGGFTLANRESGLDALADFVGNSAPARLGRVATVTDLDGDHCLDLVVGNYRAHRDTFARGDCRGRFAQWSHDPDRDPSRAVFGHAVGLFPWDLEMQGRLDLVVFNLWHDDWRGALTDRSYRLFTDARAPRRQAMFFEMEAPFGAAVADLDGDRRPEMLLATAHRGEPYEGRARLLRDDITLWEDTDDFLKLRETPAIVDLNLDGAPDLIGDGRVMAQRNTPTRRWIGFVFLGAPSAGSIVVLDDDGGRHAAFSLAQDGRGQPSNLLTVGLGATARPRRLHVFHTAHAREAIVDLEGAPLGRYYEITLNSHGN